MSWASGAAIRPNRDGFSKRANDSTTTNARAQKPRPEDREDHRAGPGGDHQIGPLAQDDPQRAEEADHRLAEHAERRAELGLAPGEVRDEMGAMVARQGGPQRGVLGDEEVVVPRPDLLQVEELAHMPAAGGRQANPEPGGLCVGRGRGGLGGRHLAGLLLSSLSIEGDVVKEW
jgi:hypothetical protein